MPTLGCSGLLSVATQLERHGGSRNAPASLKSSLKGLHLTRDSGPATQHGPRQGFGSSMNEAFTP
jgi:hypothetical protein